LPFCSVDEAVYNLNMLILDGGFPAAEHTNEPISPLNAVWSGAIQNKVILPQLGHFYLVFPLAETAFSCAGTIIDNAHYMLLTDEEGERPFTLENTQPDNPDLQLLLLMLSPDFIADMAAFLNIPMPLRHLLNGIPLLQGDTVSHLLQDLKNTNQNAQNHEETEEIFMEIIGQILHLMSLRHRTLLSLLGRKQNTIIDLLPRMLQARQFIEARYLEPIKTQDAADHVALSEYHFARLFKAAFEVTVHQFVLRLRLDKARHLLESSTMSITDIAYAVGYNSLSAFINSFRRQFGMPPSAYRARFQLSEN
jgi:AraC-like DNA-binding protein